MVFVLAHKVGDRVPFPVWLRMVGFEMLHCDRLVSVNFTVVRVNDPKELSQMRAKCVVFSGRLLLELS